MTVAAAPPWHMTYSACARYAYIREWNEDNEEAIEQATRELEGLAARAHFVEADRYGREQWRSPRGDGYLRWVVDPRKARTRDKPQVIWVGQSRPPTHLWAPK